MCNNCNTKNESKVTECGCSKELIGMIPFIHSRIMQTVGKDKNFPRIEPEAHYNLVVNKTRALLAQAGYPHLQSVPSSFVEELAIISEIQKTKPEDYIVGLVDKGVVTPQGGKVLEEIWGILKSDMRRKFLVNALQELYGYVDGMQTLPAKEKIALLYGIQIGISSVNFFARVSKDKNSPYYRVIASNSTQYKPFPWADCIGGAVNCLGCIEGAFIGCLGCASVSSGLASSWFGTTA